MSMRCLLKSWAEAASQILLHFFVLATAAPLNYLFTTYWPKPFAVVKPTQWFSFFVHYQLPVTNRNLLEITGKNNGGYNDTYCAMCIHVVTTQTQTTPITWVVCPFYISVFLLVGHINFVRWQTGALPSTKNALKYIIH